MKGKAIIIVLCWLVVGNTQGQPAIDASHGNSWMLGRGTVEVWMPGGKTFMNAEQVAALPDSLWQAPKSRNFYFGLLNHGVWLRFTLKNEDNTPHSLVLEIVNPNLDSLQLLLSNSNRFEFSTQGVYNKNTSSAGSHNNFQFPIQLQAGDSLRALLYVRSMRYPQHFNLFLWQEWMRAGLQNGRENIVLTCFFLLAFLYIIVLGVANMVIRFPSVWYYLLYFSIGVVFVFADIGLADRYWWPHHPYLQQIAQFFLANLYLLAGTQFVRTYFQTDLFHPRYNWLFLIIMGITTALLPFAVCLPLIPQRSFAFIAIIVYAHYSLFILSCAAFIALFISSLKRRQRLFSGWFLFGFSLHGIGILTTILQYMGLLPNISMLGLLFDLTWPLTFYTQITMMAGMLLEVPVLLYVAFGRFKLLYEQDRRKTAELAELREKNVNALLLGMEGERRRIGQDLHDTLGVQLAGIKMKVALLKETNGNSTKPNYEELLSDIDHAHREMRRISHNLMPKSLYKLGLEAALTDLITRIKTLRPELELFFYNNIPLDQTTPQAAIHLYRLLLELVNNTLKHAGATTLTIQLTSFESQVLLTVEDNGKGFIFEQTKNKEGIGLSNVQHRVNMLGGSIYIDSAPGNGALISIELPAKSIFKD